jgi:SurA N-terminal domain/PPIC-type PPIASE domain
MFQPRGGVACVAACALAVVACGSTPAPAKPSPIIARVGNQPITLAQFNVRYQTTIVSIEQGGGPPEDAGQTTALRANILRSLIIDTVIREEAIKFNLEATPAEVAAQVATDAQQAGGTAALKTELAGAGGSIAQLEDEITSDLNEQRVENLFAQQRAIQVEKILAAGANFETTAKTWSDDTGTNAKGGDLGLLTAATLTTYDAAFSAAVKALAVGEYTTTPVHDAGGYDIVMLYAKSAKGWSVRHILIAAPTPYSVMDRPAWFGEVVFAAINQLCVANQITVSLTNAGGNPCNAPSPSPSPAATPKASTTATPSPKATAKAASSSTGGAGGTTAKPDAASGVKASATGTPSTGAGSGLITIGAALLIVGASTLAAGERARRTDR